MDNTVTLSQIVDMAKDNARHGRRVKGEWLKGFYRGRYGAYMTIARMMKGGNPARIRNEMRRAA